MYKKILGIIAASFLLVLSQGSYAEAMCGQGLKQMVQALNLDADQKAKILPILDQLKSSRKDTWSQMKDLNSQIKQQVESASLDQSAVDGLVDKKTKLIGDMMKARITAKNQIFNILNAQQKTALQTTMQNVEDKIAAKFAECHDQD